MSDGEIRFVEESELRAAHALFRGSMHAAPPTDQEWGFGRRSFEPGRTHGAFAGGELVGTAMAWSSSLVVPGGARVPMAAVTRVGVRSDHRRRGLMRGLMVAQLAEVAARGEVVAGLHASEPSIYGRFGYGMATRTAEVVVSSPKGRVRPEAPAGGRVRLVSPREALRSLPGVYERAAAGRVGAMVRPPQWWVTFYERAFGCQEYLLVAVHTGPNGEDGFVSYRPRSSEVPGQGARLDVQDFVAGTPEAVNALWAYLVGVDLVEQVRVWSRPPDEPVEALLVDASAVESVRAEADLWVRLVDVPAALAARPFGVGEPVLVEVVDALLPANSGVYRVGAGGAERAPGARAGLSMSVEVLAMLYFGEWRVSALAGAGLVRVYDAGQLGRADAVFATGERAWCGTMF